MCSPAETSQRVNTALDWPHPIQGRDTALSFSPSTRKKKTKYRGTHQLWSRVSGHRTKKPILLVCIAPRPPDSAGQGPDCESLCRLHVLPLATCTRAAQLFPLNLNSSTPDSAAERTVSSPELAPDSKAEGRKLRPVLGACPSAGRSEGPSVLASVSGSRRLCPSMHLSPRLPLRTAVALSPALGPAPSPCPPD